VSRCARVDESTNSANSARRLRVVKTWRDAIRRRQLSAPPMRPPTVASGGQADSTLACPALCADSVDGLAVSTVIRTGDRAVSR